MGRSAKLAPSARQCRSAEELLAELETKLREDFSLPMLDTFTAIFEGWTDVSYVERAVELHKEANGEDLLAIPLQIAGVEGVRIGICTPGQPGNPARGGTPQMERLASMLKLYVFSLEAFSGLVFVFDHDKDGQEASTRVVNDGYVRDKNVLTLDPKRHPKACAKKQVVIEDLLSLDIQKQFFESGPATCSLDYVDGELERFRWEHNSKPSLRDYVVEHATVDDLAEIIELVKRIRRACGLPD